MTLGELFAGIANAIRSKDGTTAAIPATTFPERIMAISGGGGGGGDGRPYVVNVPVNISAEVSVTAEKYYLFMLFNGVRLPRIPTNVLSSYPYAFIRQNNTTGNYDLVMNKTVPWFNGSAVRGDYDALESYSRWYTSPMSNPASWTEQSHTYGGFTIDANRPCLWSNHDIPNGSATATDIYFEGTDPVPVD